MDITAFREGSETFANRYGLKHTRNFTLPQLVKGDRRGPARRWDRRGQHPLLDHKEYFRVPATDEAPSRACAALLSHSYCPPDLLATLKFFKES